MTKIKSLVAKNYDVLMNPEMNPLQSLRVAQRYQIMIVLAVMWTTIFSAAAGAWFFYG